MPVPAGVAIAAVAFPIVADALKKLANTIPGLQNEATVHVIGQPGHNKQQLYFLALAAANGIVRQFAPAIAGRFIFPPFGSLMIEYDGAENWVRCTLRYNNTLLPGSVYTGAIFGVVGGFLRRAGVGGLVTTPNLNSLAVYNGPPCAIVGAPFGFTGGFGLVPGVPASSTDAPAPVLPFANNTILTDCPRVAEPNPGGAPGAVIPSPNPSPPGDNRSRGVVMAPGPVSTGASSYAGSGKGGCCPQMPLLIQLVFAAITNSESLGQTEFRGVPGPVAGIRPAGPRGR